ncbi:MAG TPA: membrane protein insertion efficiency factor YidD [Terriglobales bacterium]|nr:membrane protein insertion efficiency factor YidD [Terriglobales bacterium]
MKELLLAALRGYKRFISPMFSPACRFVPTCSDYAAEAIARHGAFFGTALAFWRILRCNPISRGGLNLVPLKFVGHQNQSQAVGCSHVEHAGRPCS